ncbi:MAG: FCD domain-containing protein [Clostridia bacterium]|nr:FCD domain-containing protein [Clostridia bacterium]MDR3645601.1 FCD domain-containing protein [Clostridia bacterium]
MEQKKIKKNTVVEQVMERIKDLIASGKYKAGDKLPIENELAEMFGIGRSSLREAVKIFNYLGVLESHAAKGTFVCDRSHISSEALSWAVLLGGDEINELIEIRAAIELWSVLELTQSHPQDPEKFLPTILQLEAVIGQMRVAAQRKSIEETIRLDFQFHEMIINSSNNSIFNSIYHTLRSFMLKTTIKVHQNQNILVALPEQHESLLTAIKSGDSQTALNEMQRHIQITRQTLYSEMGKAGA